MHTPSRQPVLTISIVGAILIAWALVAYRFELSLLHQQKSSLLMKVGAIDGAKLADGQIWRLITSQYLHVNFAHMMFNAICVYLLGSVIERKTGWVMLALVVFGGGTIGQYFSVLMRPELVSSGASQALMALCGFTLVACSRLRVPVYVVAVTALIVCVQIALDLVFGGAIKPGHTVGFVAGALLGPLAYTRWVTPRLGT